MHYYQHNIGDFASATRLLGPIEIGVAQILIDEYARTEKPLGSDFVQFVSEALASRYPFVSESQASGFVSLALRALFVETEAGFVCPMLDEQMRQYAERAEKNRLNASKPRKRKVNPLQDKGISDSLASGNRVASQSLTTNNQEPITKDIDVVGEIEAQDAQTASSSRSASAEAPATAETLFEEEGAYMPPKPGIPPCPVQKIVELYHKHMPMGRRVMVLDDTRKRNIRARWQQIFRENGYSTTEQGLQLFEQFFEHCASTRFLTGQCPPGSGRTKPFQCSIDFLMNASNFRDIFENKYS